SEVESSADASRIEPNLNAVSASTDATGSSLVAELASAIPPAQQQPPAGFSQTVSQLPSGATESHSSESANAKRKRRSAQASEVESSADASRIEPNLNAVSASTDATGSSLVAELASAIPPAQQQPPAGFSQTVSQLPSGATESHSSESANAKRKRRSAQASEVESSADASRIEPNLNAVSASTDATGSSLVAELASAIPPAQQQPPAGFSQTVSQLPSGATESHSSESANAKRKRRSAQASEVESSADASRIEPNLNAVSASTDATGSSLVAELASAIPPAQQQPPAGFSQTVSQLPSGATESHSSESANAKRKRRSAQASEVESSADASRIEPNLNAVSASTDATGSSLVAELASAIPPAQQQPPAGFSQTVSQLPSGATESHSSESANAKRKRRSAQASEVESSADASRIEPNLNAVSASTDATGSSLVAELASAIPPAQQQPPAGFSQTVSQLPSGATESHSSESANAKRKRRSAQASEVESSADASRIEPNLNAVSASTDATGSSLVAELASAIPPAQQQPPAGFSQTVSQLPSGATESHSSESANAKRKRRSAQASEVESSADASRIEPNLNAVSASTDATGSSLVAELASAIPPAQQQPPAGFSQTVSQLPSGATESHSSESANAKRKRRSAQASEVESSADASRIEPNLNAVSASTDATGSSLVAELASAIPPAQQQPPAGFSQTVSQLPSGATESHSSESANAKRKRRSAQASEVESSADASRIEPNLNAVSASTDATGSSLVAELASAIPPAQQQPPAGFSQTVSQLPSGATESHSSESANAKRKRRSAQASEVESSADASRIEPNLNAVSASTDATGSSLVAELASAIPPAQQQPPAGFSQTVSQLPSGATESHSSESANAKRKRRSAQASEVESSADASRIEPNLNAVSASTDATGSSLVAELASAIPPAQQQPPAGFSQTVSQLPSGATESHSSESANAKRKRRSAQASEVESSADASRIEPNLNAVSASTDATGSSLVAELASAIPPAQQQPPAGFSQTVSQLPSGATESHSSESANAKRKRRSAQASEVESSADASRIEPNLNAVSASTDATGSSLVAELASAIPPAQQQPPAGFSQTVSQLPSGATESHSSESANAKRKRRSAQASEVESSADASRIEPNLNAVSASTDATGSSLVAELASAIPPAQQQPPAGFSQTVSQLPSGATESHSSESANAKRKRRSAQASEVESSADASRIEPNLNAVSASTDATGSSLVAELASAIPPAQQQPPAGFSQTVSQLPSGATESHSSESANAKRKRRSAQASEVESSADASRIEPNLNAVSASTDATGSSLVAELASAIQPAQQQPPAGFSQ
uniref:SPOC domain-containing protein n=1 Tax=Macrostomum lignano TaxID=282301 RepID=A0A1I8J7S7_9PLAT